MALSFQVRTRLFPEITSITRSVAECDNADLQAEMIAVLRDFAESLSEKYGLPRTKPISVSVESDESSTTSDVIPMRELRSGTVQPTEAIEEPDPAIPDQDRQISKRTTRSQRAPTKPTERQQPSEAKAQSSKASPSSTDVSGPPRKRIRVAESPQLSDEAAIPPLNATMHLTSECTTSDLSMRRQSFYDEIKELKVEVTYNQKTEMRGFSTEDSREITSLLIDDTTGVSSVQRLAQFAESYNQFQKDEPDAGAVARAKELAGQEGYPVAIRKFFGVFSIHQRTKSHRPGPVRQVDEIIQSLSLLQEYEKLRKRVEDKDAELINYFKRMGKSASQGRTWVSILVDYVADELQIDRTSLVNTCQKAKPVQELTDLFGQGIILLLPKAAMTRLKRFGNQRMAPVYQALKRHVPQLEPVSRILEQRWLLPFLQGSKQLPSIVKPTKSLKGLPNTYMDIIKGKDSERVVDRVISEEEEVFDQA